MYKTIQPGLRREGKASPFGGCATTLPGGKRVTGFSVALRLPMNPVPLPPPVQGALWVLSIVAHISKGKHREVYSPPCIGWQANLVRRGAKRPENQVRRFPVEEVPRSGIGGGERSDPISRMLALLMIKTFTTGLRPRENMPDSLRSLENHTTAPSARGKCTPFGANAPPFPRRGNS